MKIVTVVGTRPEIIRLSRVISCLQKYTTHLLVHTGQNYDYELNQIFFKDLEIQMPDYFLETAAGSASQTIANVIAKADAVLREVKPDAVLILGDTNSCLAAYPAKRQRIPVFHMEAGNRCFDERVPEEINRRIVDHISDINLPYSSISREYLLKEGIPADRVIKTGSPMFEVLEYYRPKIDRSEILQQLGIEPNNYFLVSAHREENIDSQDMFTKFVNVLDKLGQTYSIPVIVSTHPRTCRQLKSKPDSIHPNVQFLKPFGFCDYIKLQINARATLSDSGTITEESSILNIPALNIREAHERPEGMEEGAVMMTGLEWGRIVEGLRILNDQPRDKHRIIQIPSDYSVANVSEKIVRIIQSYTDYVNRLVWHKKGSSCS